MQTYQAITTGAILYSRKSHRKPTLENCDISVIVAYCDIRSSKPSPAKKLAKASLLVDKVQNDYMAGKCQLQDVKDAIAQYDLLLKTGNFAACKRKPEEKQEETSFSEITKYCETHGYPCTKKIEWPKDVVDQTLDALQYIAVAINDTLSDEVGDSK